VRSDDNRRVDAAPRFARDRLTWLAYVMLGYLAVMINAMGPALSGLRLDLGIGHAEASLHSSLFAVGMLLVGLAGDRLVRGIGRRRTLWAGVAGIGAGTAVFVLGASVPVTLLGAFLIGMSSSTMLVLVPAILSDRHGAQRSTAFSEANAISSAMGGAAPILIGLSLLAGLGWRPGLVASALLVMPLIALMAAGVSIPEAHETPSSGSGRLPRAYWAHWLTAVLVVSAEFCVVYWATDYLRTVRGVEPALAASAVSLFLVGMVAGRAAAGRLVRRAPAERVLMAALPLCAAGFGVFWLAPFAALSMAGVLLTGLGVASLYPMALSLAVGAAVDASDRAASRAVLASGLAVLGGPLLLAALADMFGLQRAFAIVPALLATAWLVQWLVPRLAAGTATPIALPTA
jgi:MFS family permease